MDFKQIQSIIKDFEKSTIQVLEMEVEGFKLKLNKNTITTQQPEQKILVNETKETVTIPTVKEVETFGVQVKSPLVGTYYAANGPKEKPFVTVGQYVEKGTTVCIVEAMKIMNEISAPVSGIIEAIHPKDGDAVGYDQVLMVIKDAK